MAKQGIIKMKGIISKWIHSKRKKKSIQEEEQQQQGKAQVIENNNILLHKAAQLGELSSCEYLIENGALVNHVCKHGYTPLLRAVKHGRMDVVRLLIEKKATVDIGERTTFGHSPLHWACQNGHLIIVKMLIEQGKASVNRLNKNGETPLWIASRCGYFSIVDFLLDKGADGSIQNKQGHPRTPLKIAYVHKHTEIVKLLAGHELGKFIRRRIKELIFLFCLPFVYFYLRRFYSKLSSPAQMSGIIIKNDCTIHLNNPPENSDALRYEFILGKDDKDSI